MKLTLFLIGSALLVTSTVFARDRPEPRILGGWQLVKFVILGPDGKATPFCEDATGRLIYEKHGNMSVAINCGANVPEDAPAHAYGGMLFYSGTFSIQGNSVLHRITNSSSLNLIGKEVPRTVASLTDTALVLTGNFGLQTLRIEWRRSATPPEFAPQSELALLTYLKLKPGTEADFMQELEKIIKPSLAEPGNIAWFVQRSEADPTNVVFYTRWLNEDALHAHLASPPLVEYISRTAPLLETGYPQFTRFHPIDTLR